MRANETVLLSPDDLEGAYCEACLAPLTPENTKHHYGYYLAYGVLDANGCLVGFICMDCGEQRRWE